MSNHKYLELLRFYITSKIEDGIRRIESGRDEFAREVSNIVLSTGISVFLSEALEIAVSDTAQIGACNTTSSEIQAKILQLFIFIILFIVARIFVDKISKLIWADNQIKNSEEHTFENIKIKNLIDKFDHVACDSAILSLEYKSSYEREKLSEMRVFYYFEMIYYAKKSLEILKIIYNCKEQTIDYGDNIYGIDIYRFINIFDIIKNVQLFAQTEINKIQQQEQCISQVRHDIEQIKKDIDHLDRRMK